MERVLSSTMSYFFRNRLLNILAFLFCLYMAYNSYTKRHGYSNHTQFQPAFKASGEEKNGQITINLDPHKKYDDYTWTEKITYHMFRSEIEDAQKKAQANQKKESQ
ncbi:hypothetical protein EDM53_05310 [Rickettsiales endosymbiont of Peranema trichophorum]|uniref:hypothetical protein n=1 Tax=Rickettsiales endosymbiont of Peranema trichophorum TaxID=2486577 RepID=UPI001022CF6D|nr:hypothetical protein [Rickettsiales endosymbiont of Peranema trichophorum]RZI45429.1 hypothetical protein EDM53_05310 [Rickettsiales endosymbiont of Peranema trichophorum]